MTAANETAVPSGRPAAFVRCLGTAPVTIRLAGRALGSAPCDGQQRQVIGGGDTAGGRLEVAASPLTAYRVSLAVHP